MKVTFFVSSLSGGGAERVVANLANFLTDKGIEVDVITVTDEVTYQISDKVRHLPLSRKSKLPHFFTNLIRLYRLNRYLRKQKVDLYIPFLPFHAALLMRQRRIFKAPVAIAERGDPYNYWGKSEKKLRQFQKLYSRADGYFFQTDDAREYYRSQGIDVTNSQVIPNAINPLFLSSPKKDYTVDNKLVVGIGRFSKQKNFHSLIKAFAKVHESFPEHRLVIYGDGPLRPEYQQLIESLGLQKVVDLPGYINDIPSKIINASVFALSSDYEGMPNALAEAMALGVPCVSTDCPVGGPKFLIKDGENGLLVPVNDPDALAAAINKLLSNLALAESIGRQATRIADDLTPEVIYGRWLSFIQTFNK